MAQADGRFICHIHASSAHDVIDDTRQVGLACNRLEMLINTLLRGFVIVGYNQQQAINTLFFCFLAKLNALGSAVGARPGDDCPFIPHRLFDLAEETHLFIGGQCRGFPGGTRQYYAVTARVEEGVGKSLSLLKINSALLVKRGNHCSEKPSYLWHVRLL